MTFLFFSSRHPSTNIALLVVVIDEPMWYWYGFTAIIMCL